MDAQGVRASDEYLKLEILNPKTALISRACWIISVKSGWIVDDDKNNY